jgi:cytochrome b561
MPVDHRTNAPPNWHYATPAVLLHWAIAALVLTQVGLGVYMMAIEELPGSAWYFALHVSFGLTIAALMALRIVWRLGHKPAPLPASVPAWQVALARLSHYLLYLLLVLMPVTGYLGRAWTEDGVAWFGLALPARAIANDALAEQWFSIHIGIAWVLVALVAVHVAAALKHLLVDKDGVFFRMWPRR